jgi:cyclomaltodextrinase / maltogenic alpha-amylase / neopullulanase
MMHAQPADAVSPHAVEFNMHVTPISHNLGMADITVRADERVHVRRADGSTFAAHTIKQGERATARVMVGAGPASFRVIPADASDVSSIPWQHLETRPALHTPDWAKGATWYQIFPERFANANPANDPRGPDIVPKAWNSPWYPGDMRVDANIKRFGSEVFKRRYGGDLEGVVAHLDHLQSLGITAIYLNPLFVAQSLHKYDTADYRHIDHTLAGDGTAAAAKGDPLDPSTWTFTSADRYFIDVFLPACKRRNIRVIIDGVFNHVGRTHWAFQDVQQRGIASPFADWFVCEFDDRGTLKHWQAWDRKDGWLPEFRQIKGGKGLDRGTTVAKGDLNAGAKKHIIDITRRWMDPNNDGDPSDGVDGWRLDVSGEVGDEFWRDWRHVVKSLNPDALIVAEIWHNATEELTGATYDTQMFYPFAYPLLEWLTDTTTRERLPFSSAELVTAWERAFTAAPQTQLIHQTLLSSHDTERLVNMLANPGREFDRDNRVLERHHLRDEHPYIYEKPGSRAYALQTLIAAIQATYVGSPMIYYGDEIGMWGADDPCCRMPMAWDAIDDATLARYRRWFRLRQDSIIGPVLRYGGVHHVASSSSDELIFERFLNDITVRVTINRADATAEYIVVAGAAIDQNNRTP